MLACGPPPVPRRGEPPQGTPGLKGTAWREGVKLEGNLQGDPGKVEPSNAATAVAGCRIGAGEVGLTGSGVVGSRGQCTLEKRELGSGENVGVAGERVGEDNENEREDDDVEEKSEEDVASAKGKVA